MCVLQYMTCDMNVERKIKLCIWQDHVSMYRNVVQCIRLKELKKSTFWHRHMLQSLRAYAEPLPLLYVNIKYSQACSVAQVFFIHSLSMPLIRQGQGEAGANPS